ncbi:MAG: WbqC family protein [Bacteroidota bacterium]
MLKVAIMQPYFLPYIGYFQLINAVDEFILYDDVNYIKKGWINRNNVLLSGKASLFTIPLKEASQNKLINEIEISQEGNWQNKLLKTIEQSYKKSPQFDEFFPILTKIIHYGETNISTYILHSIVQICNYLEINTTIIPSSSVFNNVELKAQNRIIDICKKKQATQYINPIGGTELYQKENFDKENIMLNFIKTKPIQYTQFSNEFVPYLSIIDSIMFNDKAILKKLLNEYELI